MTVADKGRDFKISILSDADKFDLSGPANDLEDLGRAAKDTSDQVDKSLGDMGQDGLKRFTNEVKDSADKVDRELKNIGKDELNQFEDKAKSTAKKVDNAFDVIAKSSKSNMRKVDDDLHKAEKSQHVS